MERDGDVRSGRTDRGGDVRPTVFGVPVCVVSMDETVDLIDDCITTNARSCICVTHLAALIQGQDDERLREIRSRAALVVAGDLPLVWTLRWQRWPQAERIRARALFLACCERSVAAGYRHFLLGGSDRSCRRVAAIARRRFPDIAITGACSTAAEDAAGDEHDRLIQQIHAAAPDVVWAGLSSPAQEYWIARHLDRLDVPVVVGLGPGFGFGHAGAEMLETCVALLPAWRASRARRRLAWTTPSPEGAPRAGSEP